MASQTDLDQGGTVRYWETIYMGPSVGWVRVPSKNYLPGTGSTTTIGAPGTYTLDLSTNFVQVAVNGAVIIILPSVLIPANAVTQPGRNARTNITIVDIGGDALANPITIKPASLAETIMGLTQIQITSNFGGFVLEPVANKSTWVNAQ